MEIRLNKYLAERLGLSRRQADDAIASGKVTVNGEPAVLGQRIRVKNSGSSQDKKTPMLDKIDEVCYNEEIVAAGVQYVYLGMSKPTGYVCSRRRQGDTPTIFELLPPEYQSLKTVGRLDKDSSGLILLTNDGDFAFRMTHPQFVKTKIYEVELDKELAPLHQQEISDFGIEIGDGVSRLGLAKQTENNRKNWIVTMTEGRNRQIRRTFAALGYEVVKLHRTDFGKYHLGKLEFGDYEIIKN